MNVLKNHENFNEEEQKLISNKQTNKKASV